MRDEADSRTGSLLGWSTLSVGEVKRLFAGGAIDRWEIVAAPVEGGGFGVRVGFSKAPASWWFIRAARGQEPRVFRSIDAAMNILESVGFKVDVLLGGAGVGWK